MFYPADVPLRAKSVPGVFFEKDTAKQRITGEYCRLSTILGERALASVLCIGLAVRSAIDNAKDSTVDQLRTVPSAATGGHTAAPATVILVRNAGQACRCWSD